MKYLSLLIPIPKAAEAKKDTAGEGRVLGVYPTRLRGPGQDQRWIQRNQSISMTAKGESSKGGQQRRDLLSLVDLTEKIEISLAATIDDPRKSNCPVLEIGFTPVKILNCTKVQDLKEMSWQMLTMTMS